MGIGRLHSADPQPRRAIIKQAWRSFVIGDMILSRDLLMSRKMGQPKRKQAKVAAKPTKSPSDDFVSVARQPRKR